MAVREAAVNAVLHGNAYDPGKKVALADSNAPRKIWSSSFATRARGWTSKNSRSFGSRKSDEDFRTRHFFIRSFMDEVEIHPSPTGTEIKLIKHVHGSSADGKEASQ